MVFEIIVDEQMLSLVSKFYHEVYPRVMQILYVHTCLCLLHQFTLPYRCDSSDVPELLRWDFRGAVGLDRYHS